MKESKTQSPWKSHKKAENQQGAHEDNYKGKKQSLKKGWEPNTKLQYDATKN